MTKSLNILISLPIIIVYFKFVVCNQNCLDLEFSISQSVENEGFHRDVNWLIESLHQKNLDFCNLSVQLNIPVGIYVDPDQVSQLVRKGKLLARVMDNVNVETPAHESVEHAVNVFVPNKGFTDKILIQIPIHLRYQRAVITGGYAKVDLPKPLLLIMCSKEVNLCRKFPTVKAPCDVNQEDMCYWKNVTYQALFDEVQLFVPIGDLDDYPLVSVVTLLLGCAGSIYILSLLSSAPV